VFNTIHKKNQDTDCRELFITIAYTLLNETYYKENVQCRNIHSLKVVGNEKLGGLKFLQLLGIGLGPWRSISIFNLNMPFANTKRISVSGLSSNMNRR